MKCAIFLIAYSLAMAVAIPFEDPLRLGGQQLLADVPEAETDSKMTIFELPKDLRPESYEVHVTPDLEKATFEGKVKIAVQVDTSTNYIILNAKYIKLAGDEPVKVTRINTRRAESFAVTKSTFDVPNEQLTIEVAKALSPKADYLIEISYTGLLGKDMMGFYLSSYSTKDGKEKLLGSTQFEPTGARRAFPCFDQPNYKTPFTISITRNKAQTSISNMPLDKSEAVANSDKVIDSFKKSPNMPTYLVGFAVFEFKALSDATGTFRVWGREDVIATQGKYIFEKGQKILKALSDYMGIDYYSVMPKMDLVAVPDFDAGAMENWGMNTYREKFLLTSSAVSTTDDIEKATAVVTHEFSHQWFGDLVTPASWNYAWLNEAFARYFQYAVTALIEPKWRMEDLFVVEQVQTAFNSDLKDAHPMTSKTTTPESIAATFDHIIYNKGGSVLRMIENAVSPPIFKASLRLHLKNGASETLKGTVEPANLWDAFDDIIFTTNTSVLPKDAQSITDFTYEWVNSPGFPLVTFTRNYTSHVVTVTQERFLAKKADLGVDKTKWTIPVTYLTQEDVKDSTSWEKIIQTMTWFPKEQAKIEIKMKLTKEDSWFIGNTRQVGFYRVNYDDENWALLSAQLIAKPTEIHVLNRAQLLDDAFTLARGGHIKLQQALALTQYLHLETDFIPWYSVWGHLRALMTLYAETDLGDQMKTYFISKLAPIFHNLGLEDKPDEENMDKLGRSSIATWICYMGYNGCVDEAASMFRTWIQKPEATNIPPNIKDAVYCTGIKHGSANDWKSLWDHYQKTDLASEKVAVIYALGCSQDEDILYEFLTKITDPKSGIRAQDHYLVVRAAVGDRAGVQAALKFIPAKAEAMLRESKEDELSPAEDNLKSVISTLGASVRNQEEYTELTKVLQSLNTHANLIHTINRTLIAAEDRFAYRSAQQATLTTFFNQNTPSTSPAPSTSTPSVRPTSPSSTTEIPSTTSQPSSASVSQIRVCVLLIGVMTYAARFLIG